MASFAIGDIHGCFYTLLDLMNKLRLESGDKVIFLGDYIDRGPHSRLVLDYLIDIVDQKNIIALMGNHERMCVDSYNGSAHWGQVWMQNGGGATVDSYDERPEEERTSRPPANLGDEESMEARARWYESLPQVSKEHIAWMADLPTAYETDDFFFVHAGIDPEEPLEEQTEQDLLWIRNQFVTYAFPLPKRVVFGHTPFEKAQILSNKIGIDTGCVYGGKLTAINLDSMTLIQAEKNDKDGNL